MTEIRSNHLIIDENSVDLWLINIEDFNLINYQDYLGILSEDERKKYHNFKITSQRDRFLINRANLRIILAKYLKINPQEVTFNYSNKGKPYLDFSVHEVKIYFNLSHKNNYTFYGISQHNLGVDLEKIDNQVKIENLAKRFFCSQEYEYLTQLNKEDSFEYFFKLWTLKEAYLKSIGEGLSGGLDSIYIKEIGDNINYQILNKQGENQTNWIFKTWYILDNYILSVAVPSLEYKLNTFFDVQFITMDK